MSKQKKDKRFDQHDMKRTLWIGLLGGFIIGVFFAIATDVIIWPKFIASVSDWHQQHNELVRRVEIPEGTHGYKRPAVIRVWKCMVCGDVDYDGMLYETSAREKMERYSFGVSDALGEEIVKRADQDKAPP